MLVAGPVAVGKDLGTDVLGNIAPQSQLGGGLADRYPLSAYALDYHTDVGITAARRRAADDRAVGGRAALEPDQLPGQDRHRPVHVGVLAGPPRRRTRGTGGGALAPVADAITSVYENVIGEAWMVVGDHPGRHAGGSGRRWCSAATPRPPARSALSVVFVLIALFFVYQPERTIGEASRWTNTMSLAFLSGANRGTVDDPAQAKRHVADQLFGAFVYQPWVVLEFGGLRHCVDTNHLDDDGYPRPVSPHDPARDVCRDHLRQGATATAGTCRASCATRAGSKERNAEYDALRNGALPSDGPRAVRGYQVDKTDSPAVDIQQEHGAYQRLTLAVVFFVGVLGAVVLLGFLSLAVILAQVVALVLLGLRAGRAGDRDLPAAPGTTSFATGWPSSPPRSSSRRCTRW